MEMKFAPHCAAAACAISVLPQPAQGGQHTHVTMHPQEGNAIIKRHRHNTNHYSWTACSDRVLPHQPMSLLDRHSNLR